MSGLNNDFEKTLAPVEGRIKKAFAQAVSKNAPEISGWDAVARMEDSLIESFDKNRGNVLRGDAGGVIRTLDEVADGLKNILYTNTAKTADVTIDLLDEVRIARVQLSNAPFNG